jgi:cell division septation protein DedD
MATTYHFEFPRKRLVLLAACGILAGLLVFASGMVAGIILWNPARSELAALKNQGARTPALPAAAATALAVSRPPAVPALPAEEPEKPPAAIAEPPAAEAPARVAAPAGGANNFSLQIGLFEKADDARKLLTTLKDKGYNAMVVDQTDSQRHAWYAVRIIGYPTLASASDAAAKFSNKERIQALVRKSDP